MPLAVLERIRRELLDYQATGLSVLEMSHRSEAFANIVASCNRNLRQLLDIPDEYQLLFMQGGANAQFSLLVQNLDSTGHTAYADTGYWSQKAIMQARQVSEVHQVTQCSRAPLIQVPDCAQWDIPDAVSYLHVTDNETIDGITLSGLPDTDLPLIADMSSSILSRSIDISRYAMIYAGAQKNIGPAGITLVIIRNDMLERSRHMAKSHARLAPVFNYAAMADSGSLLNTPPTFAWYASACVFEWLLDQGGLDAMAKHNERQAALLYACIDDHDCYQNCVHDDNRSCMNVVFDMTDAALTEAFLEGAVQRQLIGLKGHKSRGGIRASLYNAVTDEALEALIAYMKHFARTKA